MCIISLKSMTQAIKAKKALESYYIDSDIIKLEPYMTKKGCAYGLKFQCVDLYTVKDALKSKSVRYSEIINI